MCMSPGKYLEVLPVLRWDRIVKPHRLTQSGVRSDDLVDRVSASETEDSGSNPSQVKPTI